MEIGWYTIMEIAWYTIEEIGWYTMMEIRQPKAKAAALRDSLEKSFKYRETKLPDRLSDVVKDLDTKTLERGWASAVASIQDAPKFQDTFAKLISLLEQFDDDK